MRHCMATIIIALVSTGCTHTQLKKNTIRQSETLTDVYTQQVLDNLAMFVYAPDSMPQFSYPNQGTTDVTDSVGANASNSWPRNVIDSVFTLGGDTSRAMGEAWTMQPVSDPHKLLLMRCAYQYAISSCGIATAPLNCPKCEDSLKEFHAHDENGIDEGCVMNLGTDNQWLWVGCKKSDVPKKCGCVYVGEYCGKYVWVLPEDRDKLTQLTFAILDYAVNDPPEKEKDRVVTTKEYELDPETMKFTKVKSVKVETTTMVDSKEEVEVKVYDPKTKKYKTSTETKQKYYPKTKSSGYLRPFGDIQQRLRNQR